MKLLDTSAKGILNFQVQEQIYFSPLTPLNFSPTRMKEMLPTPSTSHLTFDRIYEPAEDSYLLLDTLSSSSEKEFLTARFNSTASNTITSSQNPTSPLILEIGTGSGVVLSFLHAHCELIFGRSDILTLGIDINPFACTATSKTVAVAEKEQVAEGLSHGFYLGNVQGDLTSPVRPHSVDVLVFNPPYVPTPDVPSRSDNGWDGKSEGELSFDNDSQLLELSYAGGRDGMEITEKLLAQVPDVLSERGVAYVLLCAQNKPEDVKKGIRDWGEGRDGWNVETVGRSGKTGGWEKLSIVRIWKEQEG